MPLLDALRWQRDVVEAAASPTAARILDAVITDVDDGGALAGPLPTRVRFGSFPGLRVMAAVHLMALERQAPRVALRLPTLGGTPPRTAGEAAVFGRDVVAALADRPDVLRTSLARTPQTNETGRAALLRAVLSRENARRPVRLREIGASAGLNLRPDALPGIPALELGPLPPVADRVGCDLEPVDVETAAGRAWLSSYVWVDDVARFERLRRALAIAREIPATVLRADAALFCADLHTVPGTTTVLWHSAMWAYLSDAERSGILRGIARAGAGASAEAPLVHASWEWDTSLPGDVAFGLVVRRWDGGPDDGRPRRLATGRSHGDQVESLPEGTWLTGDPLLSQAG